ncbi:MAG: SH3 domain-containing protein [Clostridia bacterium]|nr:SH3 domain-containing protein [Clostridia bacterium]
MKKVFALLLALTVLFSLCSAAVRAENEISPDASEYKVIQKPAIVAVGALVIRELPIKSSAQISEITLGKEIFVLGETQDDEGNRWYHFNFTTADGSAMTGYVMATFCNLVIDIGMVTAGALQVRQAASTSASRVGELTFGHEVYIFEKSTTAEGEWYKINYAGSPAYVMAKYVGIMKLPENNAAARYKNYVTAEAYFENVPNGYKVVVDDTTTVSQGETDFTASDYLGQLADSRLVFIRVYDAAGNLKGEKAASIEVDTSFFGKISSFFGFIFNGFKWNEQTVEIV